MVRARVLALLALLVALPGSAPAADLNVVGAVNLGERLFWYGGYVDGAVEHSLPVSNVAAVDRCEQIGPCFTFALDVLDAGAANLRIALDTPARDDGFQVNVLGPTGAVVASMANGNQYNMESFIPTPAKGRYTIKVAPYSADYASFRMRAKLEATPYVPVATDGLLLPDLQVTRLWEFGFVAPANPLNGLFPPDDSNPPLDVAGYHPLSCGVDEQINDEVSRCLRFSFGLANIGAGNFDVRFSSDRTGAQTKNYQCVQHADGTVTARAAGTSYFHQTHGHYHFNDIITHALYKVSNRSTGAMTLAGRGQKLGYSPADQSIPRWTVFDQAKSGTGGSAGNCKTDIDNRLGLSRGWGDAYRYQRPGNFVDFNTNGDGYYVVRTTADPVNVVQESNNANNSSYAYIRVEGDHVDVIETGHGLSPWDVNKEVLN
jgi:hypothetical protein